MKGNLFFFLIFAFCVLLSNEDRNVEMILKTPWSQITFYSNGDVERVKLPSPTEQDGVDLSSLFFNLDECVMVEKPRVVVVQTKSMWQRLKEQIQQFSIF